MARNQKATPITESDVAEDAAGEPVATDAAEETSAADRVATEAAVVETNAGPQPTEGPLAHELAEQGTSDEAPEPTTIDQDVICRVRAVGGPRRRAGISFDETPRPLTRADLGSTDEAVESNLALLQADPRLSILLADQE